MIRWLVVVLVSSVVVCGSVSAQEFGQFVGNFDFRWLDDGRNMKLLNPLKFIDGSGEIWDVPSGTETDGASIPRVFWVFAAPFEGKYRNGAVVHDHFCRTKVRTWRATHMVFYNGMRAAGVDERMAKILYSAVYYFGPRWGLGTTSKGPGAALNLSLDQEKQFMNSVEAWIDQKNPSLDDLNAELDNPQFAPAKK